MAPEKGQKKPKAAESKTGDKRPSVNETVPEPEDAPSPPKRKTIEETLEEPITAGSVTWAGPNKKSFWDNAPILRESIIREVNTYTRTLVTESELRILDAIKALVPTQATSPLTQKVVPLPEKDDGDEGASKEDIPGPPPPPTPPALPEGADESKAKEDENPASVEGGKGQSVSALPNTSVAAGSNDCAPGSLEHNTGLETSTGIVNAFDYPVTEPNMTFSQFFDKLRQYWSFHRVISGSGRGFRFIHSFRGVDFSLVFDAINCVAQAIITPDGQPVYALWTNEAFDSYVMLQRQEMAAEMGFDERDIPILDNGGRKLLIPTLISDQYILHDLPHGEPMHTVLLACNRSKDPNTVTVFDSATQHYDRNKAKWHEAWAQMLKANGFVKSSDVKFDGPKGGRQHFKSGGCGMYTILNGWALALQLPLNTAFVSNDAFLEEARMMANLALSGFLDSATIYFWLVCRRFVLPYEDRPDPEKEGATIRVRVPYSSSAVHKFTRTIPVANSDVFETIRSGAGEIAAIALPRLPSHGQEPGHGLPLDNMDDDADIINAMMQVYGHSDETRYLFHQDKRHFLQLESEGRRRQAPDITGN